MALDYTAPHTPVYARDPASQPVLLDGALEGHVLVKNVNSSLPLKSPKLLSIFGYDAVAPPDLDIAGPSSPISSFAFGYESVLGVEAFVSTSVPQIAINGTLVMGGKWSSFAEDFQIFSQKFTDSLNRWQRSKRPGLYLGTIRCAPTTSIPRRDESLLGLY